MLIRSRIIHGCWSDSADASPTFFRVCLAAFHLDFETLQERRRFGSLVWICNSQFSVSERGVCTPTVVRFFPTCFSIRRSFVCGWQHARPDYANMWWLNSTRTDPWSRRNRVEFGESRDAFFAIVEHGIHHHSAPSKAGRVEEDHRSGNFHLLRQALPRRGRAGTSL